MELKERNLNKVGGEQKEHVIKAVEEKTITEKEIERKCFTIFSE